MVIKDLTGQRFGKLTVLYPTNERKNNKILWICKCDCGNEYKVVGTSLTSGNTKSCGCICKKHGMFGSRIYGVWRSMKERCYVPTCNSYPNYGSRGISVCKEWQDFIPFMEWAYANGYDENAPRGQCTLDRIDPNGNYEPNNCRWVNASAQANNRNTNIFIEYNGKLDTLSNHARSAGIKPTLAEDRMLAGKNVEEIFKQGRLGSVKKVAQYDKDMNLIKIWDSCMEVCNTLGFNMSNLRGCLSGHRKTTYGYIWKYYEEG